MKPLDNRRELLLLFRKYLNGEATPDEQRFVEAWYDSFDQVSENAADAAIPDEQLLEKRLEQQIRQKINERESPTLWQTLRRTLLSGKVAAAMLLLMLAGAWYYLSKPRKPQPEALPIALQDLSPGGDRAILTLSDGRQITLDSATTGLLARQGNTMVSKVADGLVSYKKEGSAPNQDYNTISALAGGKYSVVLSDGSRVWLNAESSITFPTAFAGNERSVKITGEVYFEVSKDRQRPFFVQVGEVQKIKVLGTRFNVNAYGDNGAVMTTLLEGSVQVNAQQAGIAAVTLRPGEQSSITRTGKVSVQENVNTEEIIAWKNGFFQFENAGIQTIMQQFGRWYDVDVSYEGKIPDQRFNGKIDRNVNASDALEILRFTGVNFRIERLPGKDKKGVIVVMSE
ncbi:DUF4974 domain-containing protein [Ravibacter arvi]|uniref:DUF4974 domain-containing protein n=1 Tax=Ravibacter arvi TaxID=2051041 RepID=A0ABP8M8Y7_9BACT